MHIKKNSKQPTYRLPLACTSVTTDTVDSSRRQELPFMGVVYRQNTLFTLNIGTPYLLTIPVLKFQQVILLPVNVSKICWTSRKQWRDPVQTLCSVGSDLCLHCLLWPICSNN